MTKQKLVPLEEGIEDFENEILNNSLDNSFLDDDFDKLLNDFISSELQICNEEEQESNERKQNKKPHPANLEDEEITQSYYPEERALYEAYKNFAIAIASMAEKDNLYAPKFGVTPDMLYSRFTPKIAQAFTHDINIGWDIMIAANPVRIKSIPSNPTDDDLLNFAEKTTDELLQMAIISYIEILIEIEGCEIAYNLRKVKYEKRKIEKRLYDEHHKRKEKMKKYIDAIKKKKFPIDAERLVSNYFKTAKKDADGAFRILSNNPATFAPIETHKIPNRLFGLIKAKPEDGFKINKEIGKFLENLKA